ncbi:hypothetical protein HDU76_009734 [Blyttiomyces sp. JEL0837]|nr:hypothetical protein HDU76_009734 [Blyttiomyces sp. JEL0837]
MDTFEELETQVNQFLTLNAEDDKDHDQQISMNVNTGSNNIATPSPSITTDNTTAGIVNGSAEISQFMQVDNVDNALTSGYTSHGQQIQPPPGNDATYIGYLDKYGSISSLMKDKTWTKRFFALIDHQVYMYSNHQTSKSLISFPLTKSTVVQVCHAGYIAQGRLWVFEIRGNDRVWILVAADEDDMVNWIDQLHQAIEGVSSSTPGTDGISGYTRDMPRQQVPTISAYPAYLPNPHMNLSATPPNSPHPSLPSSNISATSIVTSDNGVIPTALPLPPIYTPGFFNTTEPFISDDKKEPPPPISAVSCDSYNAMMMSLSRSGSENQKGLFGMQGLDGQKGLFGMQSQVMYSRYPNQVFESGTISKGSISKSDSVASPLSSSASSWSASSSSSVLPQPTSSPTNAADGAHPSTPTTTTTTSSNPFKNLFTRSKSSSGPQLFRKKSNQYFEVGDVVMEGHYGHSLDTGTLSEWAKLQEKKLKDEAKQQKLEAMVKVTESVIEDDQKRRQAGLVKIKRSGPDTNRRPHLEGFDYDMF